MTQVSKPSTLVPLLVAVLAGGGGFLYMVKLMHDMTGHMGLMATQIVAMAADIHRMQGDMASLARDVGGIGQQVRTLPQIAQDMRRMQQSLDRVSTIANPSEGIQQLNPAGLMRQMMPGDGR